LDVELNDGKLYVSFWKPVKFQILQPSGVIVQTIKPEAEVLKNCTVPRHIAVRSDGKVIYVSDWETNKLMALDMNGKIVHKYQGELEYPHDIDIYSPPGVVYLCNRDQHVMYKMTSDLKESTVILVPGDGLSFPQAMCFNAKKKHLYISSGSLHAEYKNFVKVFKWK
jgi:sugar lactone lactonase YvrE